MYVERGAERQEKNMIIRQLTEVGRVVGLGLVPFPEGGGSAVEEVDIISIGTLVSTQRKGQMCTMGMCGVDEVAGVVACDKGSPNFPARAVG